jgi:hypothetical protein
VGLSCVINSLISSPAWKHYWNRSSIPWWVVILFHVAKKSYLGFIPVMLQLCLNIWRYFNFAKGKTEHLNVRQIDEMFQSTRFHFMDWGILYVTSWTYNIFKCTCKRSLVFHCIWYNVTCVTEINISSSTNWSWSTRLPLCQFYLSKTGKNFLSFDTCLELG